MALKEQGTRGPTSSQLNSIDPATNTPISKYSSTLNVPKEFPSVLKDFTREVLRHQPANIYKFAVEYFSKMEEGTAIAQENEKSQDEAAAKIQALYRGFSTRKKNTEKKAIEKNVEVEETDAVKENENADEKS